MSKINLNKLGLKINDDVTTIDINGQDIEIKSFLPTFNKIAIVEHISNICLSRNKNFYNPCEVKVWKDILVIENYTNITFTPKQKEDLLKTYDLLFSSGALNKIMENIAKKELDLIHDLLYTTLDNIYKYQNSVVGIFTAISEDYNNLSLDAKSIQQDLMQNSKEILALENMLANKT